MHEPAQTLDPEPAGVGLAACAVGPDYQAPATEPAQLASDVQAKAYDRSRFESLWWRQFDDPVLNQLVQASLDGNRDLRVAFARLKSARSIREDAENDQFPVVTSRASSDIGKGQIPGQTTQRVNSERYDTGWTWHGSLTCLAASSARSKPAKPRSGGSGRPAAVAGQPDRRAGRCLWPAARRAVTREDRPANLKTQQESRAITETLRDAGVGNDLDVVRADARLAGVEATVPQLQAEQARARHRIATLLGQRPDALGVDLSPKALPAIAKALPVGDPGELLRRRPDIRSAERQLAAATANVGVATADLFPRVSLSGFLGFTAARGSQIGSSAANARALGPSITGPPSTWAACAPACAVPRPMPKGRWPTMNSRYCWPRRIGQRLQRLRQDPAAAVVVDAPERRQPQGGGTGLDSLSRGHGGLPGAARCRA